MKCIHTCIIMPSINGGSEDFSPKVWMCIMFRLEMWWLWEIKRITVKKTDSDFYMHLYKRCFFIIFNVASVVVFFSSVEIHVHIKTSVNKDIQCFGWNLDIFNLCALYNACSVHFRSIWCKVRFHRPVIIRSWLVITPCTGQQLLIVLK